MVKPNTNCTLLLYQSKSCNISLQSAKLSITKKRFNKMKVKVTLT